MTTLFSEGCDLETEGSHEAVGDAVEVKREGDGNGEKGREGGGPYEIGFGDGIDISTELITVWETEEVWIIREVGAFILSLQRWGPKRERMRKDRQSREGGSGME